MARSTPPNAVAAVTALPIDAEYLRRVVTHLTGIGSSPLGFRTTGTEEDAAVAAFVAAEMRAIGLSGVAIEDVEVDAWRFRSAAVTSAAAPNESGTPAPRTYAAVSFGGVPPTPPNGVTGRLVDVRDGRRRGLDRLDLGGALALLDWRRSEVSPSAVVLELARRGAVGVIVNCPPSGPWYRTPNALGCFDGGWPAHAPPMVLIGKEDATALREANRRDPAPVTMRLDADLTPGAAGHNVVGHLPGDRPGPIVVGAHHDAWFQGAFDNTSGVAAMLAMAKALAEAGHRPRHTICFTSRTGEEYGIAGSAYDWCIGAWQQVTSTHPEWAGGVPFHLCVEASGHRGLRTVLEAPVELAVWARRVGRTAAGQGWTPTGWRVAPPVAGTEQWPLLVSGIPGIACYAWEKSFGQTDYHTQFDTIDLIDFDVLAAQIRLYLLLLLGADEDPDGIIDHAAQARRLATIADVAGHDRLGRAAEQHRGAAGRAAFTPVGRGLFALDAHAAVGYPHEQSRTDLRAIDAALAELDRGDRGAAGRRLRRVGEHHLFPYLSEPAFTAHVARSAPAAVTRSWARRSHLSPSPHLWPEMATLFGEDGSRPYGPWVRAGLVRARATAERQLHRRLDAMSRSVTTHRTATTHRDAP